jgi:hypothetical protein
VGTVVSRHRDGMECLGLGTADNLASVGLQLTAPLGDRAVIRASDGVALPVRVP